MLTTVQKFGLGDSLSRWELRDDPWLALPARDSFKSLSCITNDECEANDVTRAVHPVSSMNAAVKRRFHPNCRAQQSSSSAVSLASNCSGGGAANGPSSCTFRISQNSAFSPVRRSLSSERVVVTKSIAAAANQDVASNFSLPLAQLESQLTGLRSVINGGCATTANFNGYQYENMDEINNGAQSPVFAQVLNNGWSKSAIDSRVATLHQAYSGKTFLPATKSTDFSNSTFTGSTKPTIVDTSQLDFSDLCFDKVKGQRDELNFFKKGSTARAYNSGELVAPRLLKETTTSKEMNGTFALPRKWSSSSSNSRDAKSSVNRLKLSDVLLPLKYIEIFPTTTTSSINNSSPFCFRTNSSENDYHHHHHHDDENRYKNFVLKEDADHEQNEISTASHPDSGPVNYFAAGGRSTDNGGYNLANGNSDGRKADFNLRRWQSALTSSNYRTLQSEKKPKDMGACYDDDDVNKLTVSSSVGNVMEKAKLFESLNSRNAAAANHCTTMLNLPSKMMPLTSSAKMLANLAAAGGGQHKRSLVNFRKAEQLMVDEFSCCDDSTATAATSAPLPFQPNSNFLSLRTRTKASEKGAGSRHLPYLENGTHAENEPLTTSSFGSSTTSNNSYSCSLYDDEKSRLSVAEKTNFFNCLKSFNGKLNCYRNRKLQQRNKTQPITQEELCGAKMLNRSRDFAFESREMEWVDSGFGRSTKFDEVPLQKSKSSVSCVAKPRKVFYLHRAA